MTLDLEAIKARAEAAWPGPWAGTPERVGYYDDGRWFTIAHMSAWEGPAVDGPNAEFIAAARTDVPALVAEVERLQAVIAGLMRDHSVVARSYRVDL